MHSGSDQPTLQPSKFQSRCTIRRVMLSFCDIDPTYDERAPIPRNGSRRRKLMELFHPEKLPQRKARVDKPKVPKEPKKPKEPKVHKEPKRKSTGDLGGARRKRRAAETISQPQDDSAIESANDKDSSLQPLFDFLGNVDEIQRTVESAPPAIAGRSEEIAETPDIPARRTKEAPFPGMLSGSLQGNKITWDEASRQKTEKTGPNKGSTNRTGAPAGVPPYVPPQPDSTVMPQGCGPSPALSSSSELEALKARLQQMERKFQELEAEKSQARPATATRNQHQQKPLPPQLPAPGLPPGYYPPPNYQYGPPPPRWQQPYAYGSCPQPDALLGPPHAYPHHYQQPPPGRTDPRTTVAINPHTYNHQIQTPAPPGLQPPRTTNPSYGFVPAPQELIAQKIRPHILPAQQDGVRDSVPVRQPPVTLGASNFLSQLRAHAGSATPSQVPLPSKSSMQAQHQLPGQARPEKEVPASGSPEVLNQIITSELSRALEAPRLLAQKDRQPSEEQQNEGHRSQSLVPSMDTEDPRRESRQSQNQSEPSCDEPEAAPVLSNSTPLTIGIAGPGSTLLGAPPTPSASTPVVQPISASSEADSVTPAEQ